MAMKHCNDGPSGSKARKPLQRELFNGGFLLVNLRQLEKILKPNIAKHCHDTTLRNARICAYGYSVKYDQYLDQFLARKSPSTVAWALG